MEAFRLLTDGPGVRPVKIARRFVSSGGGLRRATVRRDDPRVLYGDEPGSSSDVVQKIIARDATA